MVISILLCIIPIGFETYIYEGDPGSRPLYLSGVNCEGTENSLLECQFIVGSGGIEGLGLVDPAQCSGRAAVICESEDFGIILVPATFHFSLQSVHCSSWSNYYYSYKQVRSLAALASLRALRPAYGRPMAGLSARSAVE